MFVVPDPDASAAQAARARQARLTKPAGALGRLEDLSAWVCGAQGQCPPRDFQRVRVVVFAGDHGIARSGVSAYPPEVTAQMVRNFLAGGAGVNVLARTVGASVRVVDMSVASDIPGAPDETTRHKVRASSGRIDVEDAMTADEAARAVAAGAAIADEEVDGGADLLIPGDMGIGNTTPATVLTALLTGSEPHTLVGRGTGIDDQTWVRKAGAVRDACRRGRRHLADPTALLATVAGADIAAMAGFLARAAVRRTPVVLDGVVSAAAALVAEALAPGAKAWWVAGHRSTEPAQHAALSSLGLDPLVDVGMRLGEGTGGLLAVPILRAAVLTLAEMATFDEAGVSDQDS
ncbi:MAG: nicotinate-nucleotide--dimethylbenzimidazole phosphoribosyltransferase [Frankiaceae bacterium]|nr:nicotinate-nucleotide--dimethylbenzimidazole phosphoribosyltransferase [Frankiaceae bacterium]